MGKLQAHTLFPLLTERNAPANAAQKYPAARAKMRLHSARKYTTKTRLSAFFDCGSNPHRKAPSCAFNGAERACPNHKQKTRLSAGSNRFKWWT